jgi:hypothetical protein
MSFKGILRGRLKVYCNSVIVVCVCSPCVLFALPDTKAQAFRSYFDSYCCAHVAYIVLQYLKWCSTVCDSERGGAHQVPILSHSILRS